MVNSRQKGASYERHVAGLFKAEGYDARRGQQKKATMQEEDNSSAE